MYTSGESGPDYYEWGIFPESRYRRRYRKYHVRGVHLKDGNGKFHDFDFPVFGEGIVPFDRVHEVLQQAGYADAYCMELEGPAFNREDPDDLADKVARCVAHLRSVGIGG